MLHELLLRKQVLLSSSDWLGLTVRKENDKKKLQAGSCEHEPKTDVYPTDVYASKPDEPDLDWKPEVRRDPRKELPVRRDAEDVVAKGTLKKAKTENTSLTTRVDGLSKDVTAQIDAQQAK